MQMLHVLQPTSAALQLLQCFVSGDLRSRALVLNGTVEFRVSPCVVVVHAIHVALELLLLFTLALRLCSHLLRNRLRHTAIHKFGFVLG